mmetsp:Transcript_37448/g.79436  ORF Transcript_37448/g.79436 Transcript_37448/m.79436 type:complete len:257 (-) Transcript_37448:577-1347(-)
MGELCGAERMNSGVECVREHCCEPLDPIQDPALSLAVLFGMMGLDKKAMQALHHERGKPLCALVVKWRWLPLLMECCGDPHFDMFHDGKLDVVKHVHDVVDQGLGALWASANDLLEMVSQPGQGALLNDRADSRNDVQASPLSAGADSRRLKGEEGEVAGSQHLYQVPFQALSDTIDGPISEHLSLLVVILDGVLQHLLEYREAHRNRWVGWFAVPDLHSKTASDGLEVAVARNSIELETPGDLLTLFLKQDGIEE